MLIVLLLLLAAVAAAALALLWLVVRGHNKRLLLAGSHAVASDTPGGIGISVLCSGVHAQEQVENLLSAEYAHYEVIVVLDSLRYPVEFAAFTAVTTGILSVPLALPPALSSDESSPLDASSSVAPCPPIMDDRS